MAFSVGAVPSVNFLPRHSRNKRMQQAHSVHTVSPTFGFEGDGPLVLPSLMQVASFFGLIGTVFVGVYLNSKRIEAKEYKKYVAQQQRIAEYELKNPQPAKKPVKRRKKADNTGSGTAPYRSRKSKASGGATSLVTTAIKGQLLGYW